MDRTYNLFKWLPRILCMLAIGFVSIFALDAFQPGNSLGKQIADFFMHLVPSFLLLGILIFTWNRELIAGIIFTLIGIVMSPVIYLHNYNINHFSVGECISIIMLITFPFFVTGILFLISFFKKRKFIAQSH